MPDPLISGARSTKRVAEMKRASRERVERLRVNVTDGGYPPGTVPVTDAARQLQRLTELAQTGSRLSHAEQARLTKLSDASGSLLG